MRVSAFRDVRDAKVRVRCTVQCVSSVLLSLNLDLISFKAGSQFESSTIKGLEKKKVTSHLLVQQVLSPHNVVPAALACSTRRSDNMNSQFGDCLT